MKKVSDVLFIFWCMIFSVDVEGLKDEACSSSPKRGFDFSSSPGVAGMNQQDCFSFSTTPPAANNSAGQASNPFVFGCSSKDLKAAAVDRFSSLHKWLKGDDGKSSRPSISK